MVILTLTCHHYLYIEILRSIIMRRLLLGQFYMKIMKRSNFILISILAILFALVSVVNVVEIHAADDSSPCAVTAEQVEGQGFRVSSLGFRVSSLGFRVSSLGFRVSSLGFRVSSLEAETIIEEIVNNVVTPAWLTDADSYIADGAGFNLETTYFVIVDDFSNPDAHGYKVESTFLTLIAAFEEKVGQDLKLNIRRVDISPFTFDASLIADAIHNEIENDVDGIRKEVGEGPLNVVINMSFGLTACDLPAGVILTDPDEPEPFEVTKPFSFAEFQEGAPEDRPFEPVAPVLECIVVHYKDGYTPSDADYSKSSYWHPWKKHGRHIDGYTGYFGYNNPNLYTVTIPIGHKNRFSPYPKDQGQPTEFLPGRHKALFSVDFNYGYRKWELGHKWAIAWSKSPICDDNEPPQPSSEISPEGYSLTEYAQEQLGIPEAFVDEYFQEVFNAAEEVEEDETKNLQKLCRMYLVESAENPDTSIVCLASAGNFAYQLGTDPLKPAAYAEVVGVSATVGDIGPLWRLSHYGDVRAPGVSVALKDEDGFVTEIGAGTSHAVVFPSVVYGLYFTYPAACDFYPVGSPPLVDEVLNDRNNNAFFTGEVSPFDCAPNSVPVFAATSVSTIDENTPTVIGTVTDPDGDPVTLTVDNDRFAVFLNDDGFTWGLKALDNTQEMEPETVIVTANDSNGGIATLEVVITVNNVKPTATLLINEIEVVFGDELPIIHVDVDEHVKLKLINPVDISPIDQEAGFKYQFDCGNGHYSEDSHSSGDEHDSEDSRKRGSGHGENEPKNQKTCRYHSPGEYVASATIEDKDGGENIYDVIIYVNAPPMSCYATYVVDYQPGRKNNGKKISKARRHPHKALNEPQDNRWLNFVTLGFPSEEHGVEAGSIILGFDQMIMNVDGNDLRIWESTYFSKHRESSWEDYPEAVLVYASMDGETWGDPIGITTENDQAFDLGDLPFANYIKLVDATNPDGFSRSADGFDLDAIEGFSCGAVGD